MKPQNLVLTITVLAVAAVNARRFLGFDGNLAAAGEAAVGVVEADTDAGSAAPVNVQGVMLVEAGGAIALGAEVQVGADGKAVVKAAGVGQGRALDAAAGAGDLIRIVR
jgi:hypothetical protein